MDSRDVVKESHRVMSPTRVRTPSADYRVLEDNETDDRTRWTEAEVDGDPLWLYAGDVILRPR